MSAVASRTEVIQELRFLKAKLSILQDNIENSTESPAVNIYKKQLPGGQFLRTPKVTTTLVKNKLRELQSNVTKLTQDLSTSNQNIDDIKDRIAMLEKELENLNKLYDNEDRKVKQTLGNFQNSLTELQDKYTRFLAKSKHQLQELAKLRSDKDYSEFLEAIRHHYYHLAAVKFSAITNETIATDFVRKVYHQLNNVDCLLEIM